MARILVNCDLGENESIDLTEALMPLLDAANICCGVHAGSLIKTRTSLESAKRHGVMVGAHPGLSGEGGRGSELPTVDAFCDLLTTQVGNFLKLADDAGVNVHYVKLHGSLYHAVESDAALLDAYIETVREFGRDLGIFALAGGVCLSQAERRGLRVWSELFADRGYRADGTLVPRGEAGALLATEAAVQRLKSWSVSNRMPTVDGLERKLYADTVCVHSDSPNAIHLLSLIGEVLSV